MSAGALEGSCHCGRVRITIPRKPEDITHCNCSLCTKTGFKGIYFAPSEVTVEGETDTYVRDDLEKTYLANHRCRHCGILTHWTLLGEPPHERMGINARLFGPRTFEGLPVKEVDGASWPT